MPTTIGPLTWTPYQGGGAGTLVAVVILDASVDTDYLVPVTGTFKTPSSNIVVADSVVIFNTKNNGDVDVTIGGLGTIDIPAFVRDTIQLSNSNPQTIEVMLGFSSGTVQLQFYKGTPPVNPQLYNYAGAQAVANATLFIGGNTTGIANAQAITTNNATNYGFANGVCICGTWGFTNTGPLTLAVNGNGAVSINKPSDAGPIPLTGGEAVAGQNFIVSVNTDTGEFDFVGGLPVAAPTPPLAVLKAWVTFDAAANIIASFGVASVAHPGTGTFQINFSTPFASGTSYGYNGNILQANGAVVVGFNTQLAGSCRVTAVNVVTTTGVDQAMSVSFFGS